LADKITKLGLTYTCILQELGYDKHFQYSI